MSAVPGPDKKPEVTDERLTKLSEATINPDWEISSAKHERRMLRFTALNHAVQLECSRNLTEDPQDVTDRILKRSAEFYTYLETDNVS